MLTHLLNLFIINIYIYQHIFISTTQIKVKQIFITLLYSTKSECCNIFVQLHEEILCFIEVDVDSSIAKIIHNTSLIFYVESLNIIILITQKQIYAGHSKIIIINTLSTAKLKSESISLFIIFTKHLHINIIVLQHNIALLLLQTFYWSPLIKSLSCNRFQHISIIHILCCIFLIFHTRNLIQPQIILNPIIIERSIVSILLNYICIMCCADNLNIFKLFSQKHRFIVALLYTKRLCISITIIIQIFKVNKLSTTQLTRCRENWVI